MLPTFGLLGLTTGAEEVPLFHGWRVEPANDNNLTRAARHFSPHARLPGSRVVGVWFYQVHGPNTKPTRIVDTPHMVSSSVRGTLVVTPEACLPTIFHTGVPAASVNNTGSKKSRHV